jgi:dephospho-CoA kinase
LTGAIGAGKTAALEAFRRHGAAVVSSDRIVHDLYATDAVREAVKARLGPTVLAPDGSVDRRRVATVVFDDPEAVRWLEGLLHPLVGAAVLRAFDAAAASDPPPALAVNEVPLLYEAGLERRYDRIVVVTAPEAVRRARVAARGDLAAIEAREARLLPEAEKLRRADAVLVNDGDLAQLDADVAALVQRLSAP